jgi:protoporphyrinogen oxidase
LRFKGLDFISKIRLGLVYLWLKFDKNWQKYQKITAVDWMKKYAGNKAYKVIWEPLIKGKFHHYNDKISMAWLWARIHTRGGSKNEKGEEVLGYLDGGFGQISQKLVENISKLGGITHLNKEINNREIKNLKNDFDLIVDTRPFKEIDYIGAVTLVFSTVQNLSKYYWHNINDLSSPFVAIIQHTNLVDKSKYNGKHIYYLGTYVPQDHRYFKISDKEIEKDFLDYLKKIKPKFDKTKISEIKIFKSFYAQHIVDTNYKVPSYKVSEKLYRLNFAQIYPQDRGINFTVKEVNKIVTTIK